MKALKNFSKKADLVGKKLSAAGIGALSSGMFAGKAFAQGGGLNEIVEDTGNSLSNIPGLIQGVIYIGGAVFVAAGVLSLKSHVDNPSQTPIRQGLVRLVAGAFLLAAPAAFEAITESVGVDDETSFGLQGSFEDIDL